MYITRGESTFQYAIVHTTKKNKACSIQGHSRGCEHIKHIAGSDESLGNVLLPDSDDEKYDFCLADYECHDVDSETNDSTATPEIITEETKVQYKANKHKKSQQQKQTKKT